MEATLSETVSSIPLVLREVTAGAANGFLDRTLVRKLLRFLALGWYLGKLREDSVVQCENNFYLYN